MFNVVYAVVKAFQLCPQRPSQFPLNRSDHYIHDELSSVIVVSLELIYLVKAHLGQSMFCSNRALKSTWNQNGTFFTFLMHAPALIVNDLVVHIIPT